MIARLNRHKLINSRCISREHVLSRAHVFLCLENRGTDGICNRANIKDNVRAMVENKILNVGRASLEIEVRALCLSYPPRGFLLANVGGMS